MKNETLIKITRNLIISLLTNCTKEENDVFKKMYSNNNTDKDIVDVVNEMDISKLDHALTQCERTLKSKGRPYLFEIKNVKIKRKYNPNFGDDIECECGHPYYRHFDTYEEMYPCGCKYCQCGTFIEKKLNDETV